VDLLGGVGWLGLDRRLDAQRGGQAKPQGTPAAGRKKPHRDAGSNNWFHRLIHLAQMPCY
jgi:hypothetical protein